MRQEFLTYLKQAVQGATTLIRSIERSDLEWSPPFGGRSMLEIMIHLSTLLDTDVRLSKGELISTEEVSNFEQEANIMNPEDAAIFMEKGLANTIEYFEGIPMQNMNNKDLHFFYEEENRSYNYLLIELLEHISLHKGILFSYLKQMGYNASMGTYYGFQPAIKD